MKLHYILLIAACVGIAGCEAKKDANADLAASELLRNYLVSEHRMVVTDTNSRPLVWSDGAIVEFSDSLPPPIKLLTDGTPKHTDIRTTVKTIQAGLGTEYRPGRVQEKSIREGFIQVDSGTVGVFALVNPVYLTYAQARYPDCSILVKSRYDPVVFAANGQIKALIMPVDPNKRPQH